jgi:hypothetical protein
MLGGLTGRFAAMGPSPRAPVPWHIAQFASKSAWPADTSESEPPQAARATLRAITAVGFIVDMEIIPV